MPETITQTLIAEAQPKASPYDIRDTKCRGFLARVMPSGSITFYVQLERGKRFRIGPADAMKPEIARKRAAELLSRHTLGEDVMADKREARAHTLGSFVDQIYEPWAEANLKTGPATIRTIRCSFADLLRKKLAGITARDVEKIRSKRRKEGTKPSTLNRELADLRAMLNRAVEWGQLSANPIDAIKPVKVDNAARVRFLSDDESRALMAAIDDREERLRSERDSANAWRAQRGYPVMPDLRACAFADALKPAVIVSLHTGMRRGELFSLDWSAVSFDRQLITIEGGTAKSGRTRHLPLNKPALEALRGWQAQTSGAGPVFPGEKAKRRTSLRKPWDAVLAAAGIKGFRWHDMRHTFGSRLAMAGVGLNVIRELLGHSGITVTLRYAHLQPEARAAAVALLVK